MRMADREFIGTSEAARILHVTTDTIRAYAQNRYVTHRVLPGGQLRFRRTDIEALIIEVPAATATP